MEGGKGAMSGLRGTSGPGGCPIVIPKKLENERNELQFRRNFGLPETKISAEFVSRDHIESRNSVFRYNVLTKGYPTKPLLGDSELVRRYF